jgi:PASTA domain-containing protein
MAWRGESEDQGIYYTTGTTTSTSPSDGIKIKLVPQEKVWGIGSDTGPALTSSPYMLVKVPDCTGGSIAEAWTVLTNAGLELGRTRTISPWPPLPPVGGPSILLPPVVVDQAPKPGVEVNSGTRVDLILQPHWRRK